MVPWKLVESVATEEGRLDLRQRGEREFLIQIDGRVLMTSSEFGSEVACATLACAPIAARPAPRVLIGGLGMAYTLRAALDALPKKAQVTVAELTPQVAAWCKGPLARLTKGAANDPRVTIVIDDVSRVIAQAKPGRYDAIVLDLYEGPHAAAKRLNDPFYGRHALELTHRAIAEGGLLSIWSEEINSVFKRRMSDAGFATTVHHPGASRAFVVYLGKRDAGATTGGGRRAPWSSPTRPRRR